MSFRDLWTTYPFITRLLTAVGLGTGAIVGVAQAWPIIEPYIIAHRGYVTEKVGNVQTTTNELLIWKTEDTKNKVKSDKDGWAIQLQKENDPQTKALIQQRILQLSGEQQQLEDRLAKLKGP